MIESDRARQAAQATAEELFAGYELEGDVVRVTILGVDAVEVEVRIFDPAGDVTGVAAARAEAGS